MPDPDPIDDGPGGGHGTHVADISAALGYDKIVYYGASYGTQLGQFLAKEHPDLVAGVALDGVVPLTATKMIQVTDIPGSFTQIWDACAADEACLTKNRRSGVGRCGEGDQNSDIINSLRP